jgi:hypothetical protein
MPAALHTALLTRRWAPLSNGMGTYSAVCADLARSEGRTAQERGPARVTRETKGGSCCRVTSAQKQALLTGVLGRIVEALEQAGRAAAGRAARTCRTRGHADIRSTHSTAVAARRRTPHTRGRDYIRPGPPRLLSAARESREHRPALLVRCLAVGLCGVGTGYLVYI